MSLSPDLLDRLRCPLTHQRLTLVDADTLAAINGAALGGTLITASGRKITSPALNALIREDRRALFLAGPFPMLLPDDAIDPDTIGACP